METRRNKLTRLLRAVRAGSPGALDDLQEFTIDLLTDLDAAHAAFGEVEKAADRLRRIARGRQGKSEGE